jgi:hypothetical protein
MVAYRSAGCKYRRAALFMKKIISALTVISLLASGACATGGVNPAGNKAYAPKFSPYSMDNGYFSCSVPADWELKRDKEADDEYKIYEIELVAPDPGKGLTTIFVSYYSKDSDDFAGFQDFIDRNDKNAAGETKNARESYDPVKKTTIAGRKGFELGSERLVYIFPESKSDESEPVKEKIYVLPAKEGFYAMRFSANPAVFPKFLVVFEKIAKSFKGKL